MDDGHAQEIDWMDFDEAAQSNSMVNTLAVEVPHSDFLPLNTVIVDTPGEGSLSDCGGDWRGALALARAIAFAKSVVFQGAIARRRRNGDERLIDAPRAG